MNRQVRTRARSRPPFESRLLPSLRCGVAVPFVVWSGRAAAPRLPARRKYKAVLRVPMERSYDRHSILLLET